MNADHFGFIFAAYALTFVVVVGMIGATVLDYRALQRALTRMAASTPRSRDANQ